MNQRLRQGDIIWASAPDPRGFRKRRPLVILTSDTELDLHQPIVCAAITTTYPSPPPPGLIELPWDATGRSMTRLRRRSAAVASWLVVVTVENVEDVRGHVPPDILLKVLRSMG